MKNFVHFYWKNLTIEYPGTKYGHCGIVFYLEVATAFKRIGNCNNDTFTSTTLLLTFCEMSHVQWEFVQTITLDKSFLCNAFKISL